MNNTFYGPDENYYLEHHGILGMKWGKQNGPPYPLSEARHDRIVKRAEKRRQRIMKDPKKLYKHSDEFTKEEIDEALEKIDTRNKIKERIPVKEKKEKKVKEKDLSFMKKRWARSAGSLEKHVNRYNSEELTKALNILEGRHRIYDKKMNEIDRPRRMIQVGADYLNSIINVFKGFKGLKDLAKKENPYELTSKDKRKLILNGIPLYGSLDKVPENLRDKYASVLGEKYDPKNKSNFDNMSDDDIDKLWERLKKRYNP